MTKLAYLGDEIRYIEQLRFSQKYSAQRPENSSNSRSLLVDSCGLVGDFWGTYFPKAKTRIPSGGPDPGISAWNSWSPFFKRKQNHGRVITTKGRWMPSKISYKQVSISTVVIGKKVYSPKAKRRALRLQFQEEMRWNVCVLDPSPTFTGQESVLPRILTIQMIKLDTNKHISFIGIPYT